MSLKSAYSTILEVAKEKLVNLSPERLQIALDFLTYLQEKDETDAHYLMKLPLEERRKILAKQAEKMLEHYQQEGEWQELQTWDELDEQ
ncbi:MAG: hypothetical protein F6K54_10470 [Okeania sp. SIO3B5]|uniref:hypothetical protein n=1 Tax=Okeania sp. SIO3B5 TaxID=2607811 RepID=UPI0013FF9B67|nr:hypothetical protein [Okeania sp. SIO3B5]NEO53469.1 hypothetical protein [Okeania sp. SIO3B5]